MVQNSQAKTRVLVVDDAVVIRRIVSEVVTSDPELELAGWAANGKLALAKIPHVNPDCVTLDVEMPEMDGLETLTEIRKLYPQLPVIMFSTVTEKGAGKTLEALARGASDYVTKPANVGNVVACIERLRQELIPKIKTYARSKHAIAPRTAVTAKARTQFGIGAAKSKRMPEVLCIASSTGGPNALTELIPALPGDLPIPVLIVQHMPPVFTDLFAKRLNEVSKLRVEEGVDGRPVLPGHVYIAPGGKHMEVVGRGKAATLRLTEEPPENSCRPAADVLFRSVARVYEEILAVVLTGMGQDGCRGCQSVVEVGGTVLVQDEQSSVVWGMPGSVVQAKLADEVLPLAQLARAIECRIDGKSRVHV